MQRYYLITGYLMRQLENFKKPFEDLMSPKTLQDYIILKRGLLPLLDLVDPLHHDSKEYNSFSGEYLMNDTKFDDIFMKKYGQYLIDPTTGDTTPKLYIIENILQPTLRIRTLSIYDFENYIKSNQLILSLSGSLFYKHEVKSGLFIDFLKNLKQLRNDYEKQKNTFDENSNEYAFFDMRQKAIKTTMNTTYGLFGQSTYRFSNKHLANAITVQGRLTLKVAQQIGDMYLQNMHENRRV